MSGNLVDNQPATWSSEIAKEYEGLRAYTERVQEAVGIFGR